MVKQTFLIVINVYAMFPKVNGLPYVCLLHLFKSIFSMLIDF